MLVKDLVAKTPNELSKLAQDLKAELFMLRFKNATGQQDQTHKIKLVKQDIARIFTALNTKRHDQLLKARQKQKSSNVSAKHNKKVK